MADTKLSALTELAATPAVDDELYIRDVSEAAADESKRITMANLVNAPITTHSAVKTGIHGLAITAGKTITATDSVTMATNAITLAGGEVVTFSATNALSLLTTGATVMTFPAVTDTVVTLAASQTLTTKTLTSPTINGTIATTGLTMPAITLSGSITGAAQTMTGMGTIALNTGQYVGMDATSKITFTANAMAVNVGSGGMSIATTGSGEGMTIAATNDGATGAAITLTHLSTSPAANDRSYIMWRHRNSTPAYFYSGYFSLKLTNVTAASEESRFEWNTMLAGADNQAMTLSGAGLLAVDAAGDGNGLPSLFDDYDDALVLRQGIQQNNREMLADMGVLERKDTGSGYMMKIQPMVRLLAGGIYQSRQLIDNTREEMVKRIESLESKLMLLGAG